VSQVLWLKSAAKRNEFLPFSPPGREIPVAGDACACFASSVACSARTVEVDLSSGNRSERTCGA
jgi:hypothetical protein